MRWPAKNTHGLSGGGELRERLPVRWAGRTSTLLRDLNDDNFSPLSEIRRTRPEELINAYRATDAISDRPSIVLRTRDQGLGPADGGTSNHSALLNAQQYARLADQLSVDVEEALPPFPTGPGGALQLRDDASSDLRLNLPHRYPFHGSRPATEASTASVWPLLLGSRPGSGGGRRARRHRHSTSLD